MATSTMMRSIEVEIVVRVDIGEILICRHETDNPHDRFAVAIVGHVPKKLSQFFWRVWYCEVTGSRQYSIALDQGGIEIPCKLLFSCND